MLSFEASWPVRIAMFSVGASLLAKTEVYSLKNCRVYERFREQAHSTGDRENGTHTRNWLGATPLQRMNA